MAKINLPSKTWTNIGTAYITVGNNQYVKSFQYRGLGTLYVLYSSTQPTSDFTSGAAVDNGDVFSADIYPSNIGVWVYPDSTGNVDCVSLPYESGINDASPPPAQPRSLFSRIFGL